MSSCFLCHRPVLGIAGIESFLDSYLLNGMDEQGLIDGGLVGECHLVCLERHPCGATWAKALIRHYSGPRRYRHHAKMPGMQVLVGGRPEAYWVVKDNGFHVLLSPGEFMSSCQTASPVRRLRRQRVALCGDDEFNAWLRATMVGSSEVSLLEIYRRLGVDVGGSARLDGRMRAVPGAWGEDATGSSGFDGEVDIDYAFKWT
jgi:hypothetical protein